MASMTIIKEEVLPLDDVAIHILGKLNDLYKNKLQQFFGLDSFDKELIIEEYIKISKFLKIPLDNGEANYDKINLMIINFIKNEIIKGITFDTL